VGGFALEPTARRAVEGSIPSVTVQIARAVEVQGALVVMAVTVTLVLSLDPWESERRVLVEMKEKEKEKENYWPWGGQ
jgi:hypothetical protein